jgi:hypothetical protein
MQQRSKGPNIAPSIPKQKTPPAIDNPVRYGCPPLKYLILLLYNDLIIYYIKLRL